MSQENLLVSLAGYVITLIVLYQIVFNAVKNGINKSDLVKPKDKSEE